MPPYLFTASHKPRHTRTHRDIAVTNTHSVDQRGLTCWTDGLTLASALTKAPARLEAFI